jgi:hypothetical protein
MWWNALTTESTDSVKYDAKAVQPGQFAPAKRAPFKKGAEGVSDSIPQAIQ